jgi:hypothetical protein
VVGKSTEQIHRDLAAAARKVCLAETQTQPSAPGAFSRCYRATLKSALTTLEGVESASTSSSLLAQR